MSEWISVEDHLPQFKTEVLLFTPGYHGRRVQTGVLTHIDLSGNNWKGTDGYVLSNFSVTHWMPLPEPPEVKE